MASTARKTALVMGVANRRSIAWACVESFLENDFNVVFTYQSERFQNSAHDLLQSVSTQHNNNTIHALECNVETDIPLLFQEKLPSVLAGNSMNGSLSAIVHSIAYAPKHASLLETNRQSFQVAHDISAYSFLETAREALPLLQPESSLTTLSYLGAVRAVPNYNVMGSAKASLESLVRGLALELGSPPRHIRVNSVSAGPLNTLSARGITGISELRNHVEQHAPLKCNITAKQVADTIVFLATKGTGITGQAIYVDGGYSIVAGP